MSKARVSRNHKFIYDKEIRSEKRRSQFKDMSQLPPYFVYENTSEAEDTKELAKDIEYAVNVLGKDPSLIIVLLADESFVASFKKYCNINVHIDYYNFLLKQTKLPSSFTQSRKPNHRFSMFSRRYTKERLWFYAELLDKKLLENYFKYTFHNLSPYDNIHIPIAEVRKDNLIETHEARAWINRMPFRAPGIGINDGWDDALYNILINSYFHVVIETWYQDTSCYNNVGSWLTEKTWKAIACKKPFLMHSSAGTLQTLKDMGFKTFDKIFDETYDSVIDPTERRKTLITEIDRLCKLDIEQVEHMVKEISDVTDYNFELLIQKKNYKCQYIQYLSALSDDDRKEKDAI